MSYFSNFQNSFSKATLVITLLFSTLFVSLSTTKVFAGITDLQKAGNIQSRYSSDFETEQFKQSVRNLKAIGADTVVMVIPYRQQNINTSVIYPGPNTPSDSALLSGTQFVKSQGMKVNWKMFVDPDTLNWRANINPTDKPAWFRNYTEILLKYGRFAQSNGVEMFILGTEMASLTMANRDSRHTGFWKDMIRAVRAVYSGKLTYGANHGDPYPEKDQIGFWEDLDYIGISAYFQLSTKSFPSLEELKNNWAGIDSREILPLAQRYNKPIIFTEIGYRATDRNFISPGDYNIDGNYNEDTQALGYESTFQYFANSGHVKGIQFWDWNSDPNYGGGGNKDFSPQNKKAEQVIKKYFTATATQPPNTQPIKISSRVDLNNINLNQNNNLNTTISNTGTGNVLGSEYLVDVEIYENNSTFVFQDVQLGKDISIGQLTTFSTNWKPTKAGNYTIKVGLFTRNWSKLYEWNDNAKTVTVQGSNPPTSQTSMQIWWPANNVSVSGVQPFQAVLPNTNLDDYNMFWQVDNGGLVTMYNDPRGGGHKRFDVDLTGWRWKPNGSIYTINFVAKTKSGVLITQKSIDIKVN